MNHNEEKFPWRKAFRLALTLGIVWGISVLLLGIVTMHTNWYAHEAVEVLRNVYYGYGSSWEGAAIGLAWGFGDAFFGTLIVTVVYNVLCFGKPKTKPGE